MAVSQSMCKSGVKCAIDSGIKQSYCEPDLVIANHHFSYQGGTDRVFAERRKEYLSKCDVCGITRSKNIMRHSQKVSKAGVLFLLRLYGDFDSS